MCPNELQLDLGSLHTFSNEMLTSLDVLTSVMKHEILAECDVRHVVYFDPRGR
jgi:hypothetical protein